MLVEIVCSREESELLLRLMIKTLGDFCGLLKLRYNKTGSEMALPFCCNITTDNFYIPGFIQTQHL